MCYSKKPDPTTTHDQNPDRPPASPAPAWGICENMLGDILHMFGDVEGTIYVYIHINGVENVSHVP